MNFIEYNTFKTSVSTVYMSAQTDLRFASQTFQQLVALCPVSVDWTAMPLIMNAPVFCMPKSISTYKYLAK